MRISPIGTDQRVLVVCAKYTDSPPPRRTAAEWLAILNDEANDYYERATFGRTSFRFEGPRGVPGDGWLELGYPAFSVNGYGLVQSAITLAERSVDLTFYHRVAVIQGFEVPGGQGWPGSYFAVSQAAAVEVDDVTQHAAAALNALLDELDSYPPPPLPALPIPLIGTGRRYMSWSFVSEASVAWAFGPPPHDQVDKTVTAFIHELGHQLNLQTHYDGDAVAAGRRDTITPWDVMGGTDHRRTHFLGWAKAERGWIDAARIHTIGPPTVVPIDQTVWLQPTERAATSGVQLIRIPFAPLGRFRGLVLENRQPINGDEDIPERGVLVTLIDDNPTVPLGRKAVVLDDPAMPGLERAPIGVGQFYEGHGVEVQVKRQVGSDYEVRVRIPVPNGPDPAITPWGAPPWETPDIWIDSPKNGFDTYRYTDGLGNPVGQGDPAWVGRDNRVYVQIRNAGTVDARDVGVNVSVNHPPGLGDAGPHWVPIGRIVFPLVPRGGAPVRGFVLWRPTSGLHTCIRAEIEDTPGELRISNNQAQENVTLFESTSRSPWEPAALGVQVFNPHPDEKARIHVRFEDIPEGWATAVEPSVLELGPGGVGAAAVAVYPAAPVDSPALAKRYRPGYIGRISLEAAMEVADTIVPIGGTQVWVHLVEPTKLSLRAAPTKKGLAIRGRLTPAIAGATIALEVLRKRRDAELVHVVTDRRGGFVHTVDEVPAVRKVDAFFIGDDRHRSASATAQPTET